MCPVTAVKSLHRRPNRKTVYMPAIRQEQHGVDIPPRVHPGPALGMPTCRLLTLPLYGYMCDTVAKSSSQIATRSRANPNSKCHPGIRTPYMPTHPLWDRTVVCRLAKTPIVEGFAVAASCFPPAGLASGSGFRYFLPSLKSCYLRLSSQ
jgi:hypothetical protein